MTCVSAISETANFFISYAALLRNRMFFLDDSSSTKISPVEFSDDFIRLKAIDVF